MGGSGETAGMAHSKRNKKILIPWTKELSIYITTAKAYEAEVSSNLLLHLHNKSPYKDQYLLNQSTTSRLSVQCLMKPPVKCVVLHLSVFVSKFSSPDD